MDIRHVCPRSGHRRSSVVLPNVSPHDLFDWDGINEDILLDFPINGQIRKVLVRPDRNGFIYVIDRVTGQVLSATSYVQSTTTTGVDLKTGQLQRVSG